MFNATFQGPAIPNQCLGACEEIHKEAMRLVIPVAQLVAVSRRILLVGLVLLSSVAAWSKEEPLRSISPLKIASDEIPVLDGNIAEEIWRRAAVAGSFLQRDPEEGEPATEATEVRILYSEKALYFGISCFDSSPDLIRATELRRDDTLENDDSFSILLDTFHDRRSAYLFRTNALGTRFDAQITDENREFNTQWDEKWQSEGRITEDGWFLEIEIPLKSLRSKKEKVQVWGMNFERIIRRKNEETYWEGYSRDYKFWYVSQAGELTDLRDVETGLRLRIKPYGLGGFSQMPDDIGDGTQIDNETQVGLELVKVSITPSVTADFTLNPDFAQADVDEARFNLSRMPMLGPPELLAFFSRRVGLRGNVRLPITTGARVTADQSGFQFGFLNVLSRESAGLPGDNSTVFRLKRKVLERSYIGGIFTHRSESNTTNFNRMGGFDANFVLFDKLTLKGFWTKSLSRGRSGDNIAYQAATKWHSDVFHVELERMRVDSDFDPEMGFVLRNEIIKNRGLVMWRPRPGISFIRQFEIYTEHMSFTNQRGFLESRQNEFFLGSFFESGDFIGAALQKKYEFLEDEFEIHPDVVIQPGSYRYNNLFFVLKSYSGRRLSATMFAKAGGFFDGDYVSLNIQPLVKLNEHLSVSAGYNFNDVSVSAGDFTVHVVNTRVNINLSNKLFTSTTVQYSNVENSFMVNWRLNYIYRPGDDLFIVYNEGRDFDAIHSGLINRTFLVKFTHSFDF
jgi:hypothetical protein